MPKKTINYVSTGTGKPLLLIHGEGSSLHTWGLAIDQLSEKREVFAIDLPGFGQSEPLDGPVSVDSLADSVQQFIVNNNLTGVDVVGSSAGACITLELARRGGILGTAIALNPPGFWRGWQRRYYLYSMNAIINTVQHFKQPLHILLQSMIMRRLLMLQLSANPFKIPMRFLAGEMEGLNRSPAYDSLIQSLVHKNKSKGIPKTDYVQPVVICWGKQDKLCPPSQAKRAQLMHPGASMYWFKKCGHFPQWDSPGELVKLVLGLTDQPEIKLIP